METPPSICLIGRFARDQSGATAIEYGLIATIICLAVIVGAISIGSQLSGMLQAAANALVVN
jgi:pilus assembly protein Flp/PilA